MDNLANEFANKIKSRFGAGTRPPAAGQWEYPSAGQAQHWSQPPGPTNWQQGPSMYNTQPYGQYPQHPPPQYPTSPNQPLPPPPLPSRPGPGTSLGQNYGSYGQGSPPYDHSSVVQHVQGGYPLQNQPMPPSINPGTRPIGVKPQIGTVDSESFPPTSSDIAGNEGPKHGIAHTSGTYPTPELFHFPLSKHTVLVAPSSYTSRVINEALDNLGPHSTLYLPPGTRWSVSSTIWLKPYQELATLGYPKSENDVAWLDAEEGCTGHILSGTNMPGVRIRNIGVDGGREKYGYCKDNDCMVQLGNGKGHNQHIDSCFLKHPRQWSCLQVFQGSEGVRVTNNFIGPAGYADKEGDHMPWADGISYAGQNGLIAGNNILDATDGGIVLFGAPGTLVTSNTIVTRNRVGLGAINMVDYGPHDGNYLNTRVIHNTIRLEGSYLRIGIGQGGSVWFTPPKDSPRQYNRGATVMYNHITSGGQEAAIGYGFAVSDVEDWICKDNLVATSVAVSGDMSKMSRDPRSLNIGPGAFVCSNQREGQGPKNSSLQEEFVSGPIGRLIDINPGKSNYRVFCPGQLYLPIGQSISLTNVELSFDLDGGVRLKRCTWDRSILWESGSAGRIGGTTTALLVLERDSGKLVIVDHGNVIYDLSPSMPRTVGTTPHISTGTPKSEESIMMVSDTRPHLMLASTTTGCVFWAPIGYEVGYQWRMTEGDGLYICQTTLDSQYTLLSTMNPLGQFVILQTVGGAALPGLVTPRWPLDEKRWKVVWKSHEVGKDAENDLGSRVIFQGDGHLVVYSKKEPGRAFWGSGTSGCHPPAKYLRWGSGSQETPYLSCVTEDGKILWSTHGKTVG
ncbi:hypothetical protein FRB93_011146 [Tulasnella sp. JGI-2019a]|nr:hypothetical protein FRB93_011146 [Tulasnella sp. JGI-2019a]